METNANIIVSHLGDHSASITVSMPIWVRESDHGHLNIKMPFLGIDTVARDEQDSEKAIEEAIISFCVVAERFGHGIENELRALGWKDYTKDGKTILGYETEGISSYSESVDGLLNRLLETGENYVKEDLLIEETCA